MTTTSPLPSLRDLARELKSLHEAFAHPDGGGEFVGLVYAGRDAGWVIECAPHPDMLGREFIPGDNLKFDATAAARRLLAAAKDWLSQ